MDYPGISQVVLCIYIVYCICDTLEYPRVFLWIRVRVRGRVRAGLGLGCPNLFNLNVLGSKCPFASWDIPG